MKINYLAVILITLFCVTSIVYTDDSIQFTIHPEFIKSTRIIPNGEKYSVNIELTESAGRNFMNLTKDNVGKRLTILFGDTIITSAFIIVPIKSGYISSSPTTKKKAEELKQRIDNSQNVLSGSANTDDDEYVRKAKLLNANDFDITLPDRPVAEWLLSNMPSQYKVIWGEYITDCGEATGTAADKERDMPLCAEVEFKKGTMTAGYLALFVGTQKRGLLKSNAGVYFGYIEHNGIKHNIKRLSDLLEIK